MHGSGSALSPTALVGRLSYLPSKLLPGRIVADGCLGASRGGSSRGFVHGIGLDRLANRRAHRGCGRRRATKGLRGHLELRHHIAERLRLIRHRLAGRLRSLLDDATAAVFGRYGNQEYSVHVPDPVYAFIVAFDSGVYPELVEP